MSELNKVEESAAIAEINKWLEAIDYDDGFIIDPSSPSTSEGIEKTDEESDNKVTQKMLIKAVCDGYITFGDDWRLNLTLKNPVKDKEGAVVLEKLHFRTSIPTFEYNKAMKGIKADDADNRMIASIAAFTGVARSRIDRLTTKEIRIAQVITGYLL